MTIKNYSDELKFLIMERKDFLSLIGLGAGSIVISSCLGACGKSDGATPSPTSGVPGGKLDFTIDVASNADINSKGWTIQNGAIIAKNGSSFIALSAACTHQSNPVTYNSAANNFPCSLQDPAHGSVFDSNGERLRGPATRNLTKYNTTLSGTVLRVFES